MKILVYVYIRCKTTVGDLLSPLQHQHGLVLFDIGMQMSCRKTALSMIQCVVFKTMFNGFDRLKIVSK